MLICDSLFLNVHTFLIMRGRQSSAWAQIGMGRTTRVVPFAADYQALDDILHDKALNCKVLFLLRKNTFKPRLFYPGCPRRYVAAFCKKELGDYPW